MSGVVNVKWISTHLFWLINYKSSVIANHHGVDAIGCHLAACARVRARVIVFLVRVHAIMFLALAGSGDDIS